MYHPIRLLACLSATILVNISIFAATPIRFAVIGDRTGGHTDGVYDSIVVEIERLKPDFTMTVGDMIEGYTADTVEIRRQWDEYMKIVSPLSAPIHWVPGNHDIWGEMNDPSVNFYHKYVGEPYRSFDYNGSHFIILDNSRWENSDQIPAEQIKWLENDLKANTSAYQTTVYFHKPFWFNSLAMGKPDRLHDIFKANGVDAVFTGHFHTYFCGKYDGITYTSVGSSGGGSVPGVTGLHYHFAWVTIDDNGVHIALIKKGSVLPWEEVSAEELIAVQNINRDAVKFSRALTPTKELTVSSQEVVATFTNPHDGLAVERDVIWDLPKGWTVNPPESKIFLPAGGTQKVTYTLASSGIYAPAPTLTTRFPYVKGKDFDLKVPLTVRRSVDCITAEKSPKIDAILDEACWGDPVTAYFGPAGGLSTSQMTSIAFTYDKSNLYVAASCFESESDLTKGFSTDHDGPVYDEECVGLFLAPAGEADGSVYQIYFNPAGNVFDQKIEIKNSAVIDAKREWNGKYKVKTRVDGGKWYLEAKIPLSELKVKSLKEGDEWRVNFRRKQKRLSTSADWIIPISYEPAKFGNMNFR